MNQEQIQKAIERYERNKFGTGQMDDDLREKMKFAIIHQTHETYDEWLFELCFTEDD